MKYNKNVTGSRRKQRKAHFAASSQEKRVIMSAPLSKELRTKHNVRSMPIHKDDEVLIFKGEQKGREGKVVCVYRKKYKIHVEKVSIDKINGSTAFIPIDASNCVITKLKLNKARRSLLDRKAAGRTGGAQAKGEAKHTEDSVMSKVD